MVKKKVVCSNCGNENVRFIYYAKNEYDDLNLYFICQTCGYTTIARGERLKGRFVIYE